MLALELKEVAELAPALDLRVNVQKVELFYPVQ